MAILNVDTLSNVDIQNAIDNANDGDIVILPEGEEEWTEYVSITKKITLEGQGSNTKITSNLSSSTLDMRNSESRVTKIDFILNSDFGSGISVRGQGWRIDNCGFYNSDGTKTIEGILTLGYEGDSYAKGLIDHCYFFNTRIMNYGNFDFLTQNESYYDPYVYGSENATFVEDCVFDNDTVNNAVDCHMGARIVARHNILNNCYFEMHSVQGEHRGVRAWEIYNNTINQTDVTMWTPFFIRSGTGVIYNNTITGEWGTLAITLDNVRSFESRDPWGLADGTSPCDGNELANGYPARDQIGRGKDDWLWTDENPYPSQVLDPAYFWNNTYDGGNINTYVHNNCGHHIQENRDFYNNIEKVDYVPYTYPHPLQNTGGHMANIQEVVNGLDRTRDYVDSIRSKISAIKATTLPALDNLLTNTKILENKDIQRTVQQIQAWDAGTPTTEQQALIDEYNAILAWRNELRTGISNVQTALDSEDVF